MAWWKCSSNLFWCEVVQKIAQSVGMGDNYQSKRLYIFIQLLNWSADGQQLRDANDLALRTLMNNRQCGIVWQVCMEMGVLQADGRGYSARVWMAGQGLLPDEAELVVDLCKKRHSVLQKEADLCTDLRKKTHSEAKVETQSKTERKEAPAGKPMKEAMRPNVWMTRDELAALQTDYTDEQIAKMLDYLADYKDRTHKHYASDYQAIRRWVCRWLKDSEKAQEVKHEVFPSWCTGVEP